MSSHAVNYLVASLSCRLRFAMGMRPSARNLLGARYRSTRKIPGTRVSEDPSNFQATSDSGGSRSARSSGKPDARAIRERLILRRAAAKGEDADCECKSSGKAAAHTANTNPRAVPEPLLGPRERTLGRRHLEADGSPPARRGFVAQRCVALRARCTAPR